MVIKYETQLITTTSYDTTQIKHNIIKYETRQNNFNETTSKHATFYITKKNTTNKN